MASTETKAVKDGNDLAGLEAGLDALETVQTGGRAPFRRTFVEKIFPPIVAVALVLVVWQVLVWAKVTDSYKLPAPSAVWDEVSEAWVQGTLLEYIWTSVSRGLLGFLMALVIGTPLGLLVARVKFVRAAIGPILSGLQSLPSVAWVPPAVLWLGLNDSMMYAVILLGAVPSIANGLVSGVDQVPPLYLRAGRTLGATGLRGTWHIVIPAALPGYLAGLKQGWAFSWRSLMAAEIIASSPDLGIGLGQLLENGRTANSMSMVFLAILLILIVGIAIDLLIF
ncbi:ABC transporter permease, partial [Streptomyces sp. GLT-R25]